MSTTASIYTLVGDDGGRAEGAAWARFSAARDRTEFCASWLSILCGQIGGVTGALVLFGPDRDHAFVPVAMWPDAGRDLQHLGPAAQQALGERRGVVIRADGDVQARDRPAHVGYPIEVDGTLHGAVVLDLAPCPEAALQRALRLLHWSSAWLLDHFRQRAFADQEARTSRMALALDIVATAVQERQLGPSALAVANDLAGRLACDRVSIGFEASGSIVVAAISHTATFDARMSLVRLIGQAMDEVLDLDATLVFPPRDDDELGAVAHAELAVELKDIAVCSVPLPEDDQTFGVLTLERVRGASFDIETIELCRTVGGLLGPILALKRENERGTIRRLNEAFIDHTQMLFGPRHPGVKLVAILVVALVVFSSVATGAYRVAAKAVMEGAVQRAAVAPFDGHIAQSTVRAGDTVQAGQVMARLDDRELRLEARRVSSEREQAVRKQRQALASQDRGGMVVLAAQIAQSDAQLILINDKLARATLLAPFAGVVVSGDLSQLLGTPVEQGKLLFQVAPLDAYRVILEVDERDIAHLAVGEKGELTLSGLADQRLDISVKQITPVSSQQEGRNFFRVEANLDTPTDRVRPGMEGVAKVEVGNRKLIWIWTHSLTDWLRAWVWRQMP